MNAADILASLKPNSTTRIYDVLVAAGHDVSEWHRDVHGNSYDDFTRNPRFRADWVFTDPAGRRLVSMWHDMIKIEDGQLVVHHNAREAQMQYQRMGENYRNYQGEQRKKELSKKSRGEQWASKARTLDTTIRECFQSGKSLSVAIVHRGMAHDEETERAKGRLLDDSQWYVRTYKEDGDYVLVRGPRQDEAIPRELVWGQSSPPLDQANTEIGRAISFRQSEALEHTAADSGETPDLEPQGAPITADSYGVTFDDQFIDAPAKHIESTSTYYERSPACRRDVLLRSKGLCEYCGMPGFTKANGNTYIETHHIVALAENGHDHPTNMIALCPNDHREAHHGVNQSELRELFLTIVQAL